MIIGEDTDKDGVVKAADGLHRLPALQDALSALSKAAQLTQGVSARVSEQFKIVSVHPLKQ